MATCRNISQLSAPPETQRRLILLRCSLARFEAYKAIDRKGRALLPAADVRSRMDLSASNCTVLAILPTAIVRDSVGLGPPNTNILKDS
jgi:hypothetical protein